MFAKAKINQNNEPFKVEKILPPGNRGIKKTNKYKFIPVKKIFLDSKDLDRLVKINLRAK